MGDRSHSSIPLAIVRHFDWQATTPQTFASANALIPRGVKPCEFDAYGIPLRNKQLSREAYASYSQSFAIRQSQTSYCPYREQNCGVKTKIFWMHHSTAIRVGTD
jgi:hypothetical protein